VHYKTAFTPPAPFEFVVVNSSLTTQQYSDFTLQVKTRGNVIPENVAIKIGEEVYYLQSVRPGLFEYTFSKVTKDVLFSLQANDIQSNTFHLNVVEVPTLTNFQMQLQYPAYLGKKTETIQGTGNAVVPEGTVITWNIQAVATDKVVLHINNSSSLFADRAPLFSISRKIMGNLNYEISTSNKQWESFEKLAYQISVVKDQFPSISMHAAPRFDKVTSCLLSKRKT
jgi:hypothetical protein